MSGDQLKPRKQDPYALSEEGSNTRITLAQDNNPTAQGREHSEKNEVLALCYNHTVCGRFFES